MGALLIIAVVAAAGFFYRTHLIKMRAFDFAAELQRMKDGGELPSAAADYMVPREVKRSCITLITNIGSGQVSPPKRASACWSACSAGVDALPFILFNFVLWRVANVQGSSTNLDHDNTMIDIRNALFSGCVLCATVWRSVKATCDESTVGGVPGYLVAVKTSKETDGDGARELLQEAAIMAQVPNHEHLVSLVGVVTKGKVKYDIANATASALQLCPHMQRGSTQHTTGR